MAKPCMMNFLISWTDRMTKEQSHCEEDHEERLRRVLFSLPQILLKSLNITKFQPQSEKISSTLKMRFKKRYFIPLQQTHSENILRVKKLHGWAFIRCRTWRKDGKIRLVRLISWDGRLASLQSRGTSRNLRQILKWKKFGRCFFGS